MTTRTFRQSELTKFKRCPRSWLLSYKLDGNGFMFPPGENPLSGQRDIGTIVHAAVHALYLGKSPGDEVDYLRAQHQLTLSEPLSPEWEKVYRLSKIMVEGYEDWLQDTGADASEQTTHLEQEVSIQVGNILGDAVTLVGRVDRITYDTLADEYIVEDTKTVTSIDQFTDVLQVGSQGLVYALLVRGGLGLRVARFRHNMLRKVQRTAKAIPPFYARHEVRFSESQIENAWTHTVVTIQRMVEALQKIEVDTTNHHIYTVPSPTSDCTWDCDFLHICPMMDDGSDWYEAVRDSGIYIKRESTYA